ncbi:MAG: hypothetical protein JWO50_203 [Candidatus Kaiserbacteria bacterium]|nr:hypothetical protein [Candidatus Kaiserbacteria bacterium]
MIKIASFAFASAFALALVGSVASAPITATNAEAAGNPCGQHRGDYMGIDERCQPKGSRVPRMSAAKLRALVALHSGRGRGRIFGSSHDAQQPMIDEREFSASVERQPNLGFSDRGGPQGRSPTPEASQNQNASKFGEFKNRCEEQAAKRAEWHRTEVRPEVSGDMNSLSRCHFDARFTESGAI